MGPVQRLVPEHRRRRRQPGPRRHRGEDRPARQEQRRRHRRPGPAPRRTARRRRRHPPGQARRPGPPVRQGLRHRGQRPGRRTRQLPARPLHRAPGPSHGPRRREPRTPRRREPRTPRRREPRGPRRREPRGPRLPRHATPRRRRGPRRPARGRRPPGAADHAPGRHRRLLVRLGRLADRQRARDLRPPGHRPPVRRRDRFPRPVGLRPHRHLRPGPHRVTSFRPGPRPPHRLRLTSLFRRPAAVPGDLAVGGGRVRGRARGATAGAVRARACRPVPGGAGGPGRGVLRHPRAARHLPPGARRQRAAAEGGDQAARAGAGRRVDRHRLAGHHGGRRAQRTGGGDRTAPHRSWNGMERFHLNDGGTSVTAVMPEGVALARDLVGPAMESAISRLTPDVRIVAAYHLGLADAEGNPTGGGSGKALRPALALLSARAAGAPQERGVTSAVAVELVHNFSLLHDDIMDGDTERRHRPTAWTVFGVGAAILAGDALLALAQDMLLEDGTPQGPWAARCLSAAVQRLIAGQGADLAFEKRDDVTLTECLEMAGDKTAALMACACSIGAVHLGAPPTLAMALAGFGAHVGLAFQLTDDLLGIWGAPEVTGKPVRADLRARKKSLPVVAALNSGTPQAAELRALLTDPQPLTEDDLIRAADLVVAAGGKQWAEDEADVQLAAANASLADIDLSDSVRAELTAIAEFITARQW